MPISFIERNSNQLSQHRSKHGFRMYKNPKTNPFLHNVNVEQQIIENDNVINQNKIPIPKLIPVPENPITKAPENRHIIIQSPNEQWEAGVGNELNQSINLDDIIDINN